MITIPLNLEKMVTQKQTPRAFARFLVMLVALLALPLTAAAWSDLQLGNTVDGKWDAEANTMNVLDGTTRNNFSYTITANAAGSISFRIYGSNLYGGNTAGYIVPDNNDDEVDATKEYQANNSKTNASGSDKAFMIKNVAAGDKYTITASYNNDNGTSWHWHLSVTKSSTGGGTGGGGSTTTTVNKEGLYIYGTMFDGATLASDTKLHYKLLQRKGNTYFISVLAADYKFNPQIYSTTYEQETTISLNGATFKLAYVDAEGNVTTYTPSAEYSLTSDATPSATETLTANGSGDWKIVNNGGMYNLVVTTDDNGVPQSWTFESDPLRIVGYKAGSASDWTTNSYMYCVRKSETDTYNNNFFGSINYNKSEEFKWILGNMWFGSRQDKYPNGSENKRKNDNGENLAWNDNGNSPNMTPVNDVVNGGNGVYFTEFNPSRGDYMIKSAKPKSVFIAGPAVGTETSSTFTEWDPKDAIELKWDDESQSYMGEMTFTQARDFRFLLNDDATKAVTLKDNVGEDDNHPTADEAKGGDTWDNNKTVYQSYETSDGGKNIGFDSPEGTRVYTVRFYFDARPNQDQYNFSNFDYHYTLNAVTLPYAEVSQGTVNFGQSVTPQVSVTYPNNETGKYVVAYTIDGTDPTYTISTVADALPTATGTTKVVKIDEDEAYPYVEAASYYVDANGAVHCKSLDDATNTVVDNTYAGTVTTDEDGNKAISPVKAQAFRQYTSGGKNLYKASGVVATGTYTLQIEGGLEPGTTKMVREGGYKLTVDAPTTTQINRWIAKVAVTSSTTTVTTPESGGEKTNAIDGKPRPRRFGESTPAGSKDFGAKISDVNARVQVFYTNDESDPRLASNRNRHLVNIADPSEGRYITIFHGDNGKYSGTLKVWLAGGDKNSSDYYKEIPYDITYSTSESGYASFLENNDGSTTTFAPDYASNARDSLTYIYIKCPENSEDPLYVYAKEDVTITEDNITSDDAFPLTTPRPGIDITKVGEKTNIELFDMSEEDSEGNSIPKLTGKSDWYVLALPRASWMYSPCTANGVDVEISSGKNRKPVIIRNVGVGKDFADGSRIANNEPHKLFVEYDDETGTAKDVTPEMIAIMFGEGGKFTYNTNKWTGSSDGFYPKQTENKFTVEFPSAWGSLQLYDENEKFITGQATSGTYNGVTTAKCDIQDGIKTYKFVAYKTIGEGTQGKPSYSKIHSFTISNPQNGDYYTYVSKFDDAPKVNFIQLNENFANNLLIEGSYNINHAPKFDKTYLLALYNWDNGSLDALNLSENAQTTDWRGKESKYYIKVDASDKKTWTNICSSLTPGASYTVQAIVGFPDQSETAQNTNTTAELLLKTPDASDNLSGPTLPEVSFDNATATDTVHIFTTATNQLTTTGRFDVYGNGTGHSWRKLEATAKADENGYLGIELHCPEGCFIVTDMTLLENANTDGHVWTKAPTTLWKDNTNTGTSLVDLSDREKANSFSFFDRGDNRNSIVLVDKNTAIGGNAYDGSAYLKYKSTLYAGEEQKPNAGALYNVGAKQSDGSFLIKDLELTDNGSDYTNPNTFGFDDDKYTIKASKVAYDRSFSSGKKTFCLPFALTNAQLSDFGVTSIYSFKGIKFGEGNNTYNVEWEENKVDGGATTEAGVPYVVEFGAAPKNISITASDDDPISIIGTPETKPGINADNTNNFFKGMFSYQIIDKNVKGKPKYWCMSGGKFWPYAYTDQKESDNDIKPFRGYFIFNLGDAAAKGINLDYMNFAIWDGTATSIDSPSVIKNVVSGPIYNLSGQLINNDGNRTNLPKGVYIQNNKKFVIQ